MRPRRPARYLPKPNYPTAKSVGDYHRKIQAGGSQEELDRLAREREEAVQAAEGQVFLALSQGELAIRDIVGSVRASDLCQEYADTGDPASMLDKYTVAAAMVLGEGLTSPDQRIAHASAVEILKQAELGRARKQAAGKGEDVTLAKLVEASYRSE